MGVMVERFSVFFLEVEEEEKRVAFRVDERNFKLVSKDRLRKDYKAVTSRLLHYRKAGYLIDDHLLKPIHDKVIGVVRGR